MIAVELEALAAGGRHVEPGVGVAGRVLERHLDTTHTVDEALERTEIDLDVVVDRDLEVQEDRVLQPLGSSRR